MSDEHDESTERPLDDIGEVDESDPPVDDDVAEAIEDLLEPGPPHSPASDADAPPPG